MRGSIRAVFILLCVLITTLPQAFCLTVVIDPGHGGNSPSGNLKDFTLSSPNNATCPSGSKEKDLTLELSKQIRESLKTRGINCVLTRETDDNPDFRQRADTASDANPDYVVSIHFNASSDHKALGTVAMIQNQKRNPNFGNDLRFAKGLTDAVSKTVCRFIEHSKSRVPIDDSHLHGGAGSDFFHQLSSHENLHKTPKCFLEVEFIDNEDADKKLIACREKAFPAISESFAEFISGYQ